MPGHFSLMGNLIVLLSVKHITNGDQNVHGEGSVIALPDGGFVSFWGMNGSVYLQRFDSALNKVGSEQNVKPSDVNEQIDFNSATALDDGGFLVAYVVDNGDGEGNNAVFARQYDAKCFPRRRDQNCH